MSSDGPTIALSRADETDFEWDIMDIDGCKYSLDGKTLFFLWSGMILARISASSPAKNRLCFLPLISEELTLLGYSDFILLSFVGDISSRISHSRY